MKLLFWRSPAAPQPEPVPPYRDINHLRQVAYAAAGQEIPCWHPVPAPPPTRRQRFGRWCAARRRGLRDGWQRHRGKVRAVWAILIGLAALAGAFFAAAAYLDPPTP